MDDPRWGERSTDSDVFLSEGFPPQSNALLGMAIHRVPHVGRGRKGERGPSIPPVRISPSGGPCHRTTDNHVEGRGKRDPTIHGKVGGSDELPPFCLGSFHLSDRQYDEVPGKNW